MKAVHIISFTARLAFMVTMVLGLLFWVAHISFLNGLLNFLVRIGFTSIHELFGVIGVLFMFAFGVILVLTSKIRLLGVGTMAYALLIPALGLTQTLILWGNLHWLIQVLHLLVGIGAMYLARAGEKRYRHLRPSGNETPASSAAALQSAR